MRTPPVFGSLVYLVEATFALSLMSLNPSSVVFAQFSRHLCGRQMGLGHMQLFILETVPMG